MSPAARRAFIILALAVLTAVAYAPVRHFDFVQLDDPAYVLENPVVSRGLTLDGLRWAFTTGHAANWHPVTWLSHMIDVQLFGLAAGPHHLVNLALHLLNAILLFLLFEWMTARPWPSAFVAALFAVHPLHVESVAWVAERKDVLSTFFGLLAVLAYVWWARRFKSPTKRDGLAYLLVVFFYAISLMAKPMLVTLPFVLLLLDWWPLGRVQKSGGPDVRPSTCARGALSSVEGRKSGRRSSRRIADGKRARRAAQDSPSTVYHLPSTAPRTSPGIRYPVYGIRYTVYAIRPLVLEKLPLFALAAASSAITFLVQQRGGAVDDLQATPFGLRLGNAAVSAVQYLAAMLWPSGLTVIYPLPDRLSVGAVIAAIAVLVAVSVAVVRLARPAPYLCVGWLWYLGTLVPVSGLVQVGLQARANRYTYIPLVGIFVMVAWGVPALFARRRVVRAALPVLGTGILVACTLLTMREVRYWHDNVTLWTRATMVTLGVDEYHAHMSLGATLGDQGRLDEAIRHFAAAVTLEPNAADAHASLGIALGRQGRTGDALRALEEAARLDPANESTRRLVEALRRAPK
jgi:hypothetical protein